MRTISCVENLETIKLLLGAGADPSNVLGNALKEENKEMVEFLLRAGTDANINMHRRTSLVAAIWYSDLEVTELLLDYGADINAESSGGNALSAAMLEPENFDIVRLLLKRGADVNAEGGYGSMLQTAIYREQVEMVKTLLSDERIDVNAEAGENGNALDVAYDQENSMIIEILRKHEAKSTKTLSRRRTSEDSSNETILDEKSLRKNTEDDKSLCKEIMEEAILEVEYQNKDP
jgi:ankyrin repeat protein